MKISIRFEGDYLDFCRQFEAMFNTGSPTGVYVKIDCEVDSREEYEISLEKFGYYDQTKLRRAATDLARFVKEGRKIEAIKLLREITGWGLKESKDAVEEVLYPRFAQ